jgi:hypothetical protein
MSAERKAASRRKGGVSALWAHRAEGVVDDDPQVALWRTLDYYPTPPWAARACGEVVQRLDPGARSIWEPACGHGHMAHGLGDYFPRVVASDIHPHGYAQGCVADFLEPGVDAPGEPVEWIGTNPPFKDAVAFVRLALKRATRGVFMLVRLGFLESGERYELFQATRPVLVCPFAERVPMFLGEFKPGGSSAAAYCLVIWLVDPALREDWGDEPILRPIPPGTRQRLTRDSDDAFAGRLASEGVAA